MIAITIPLLLLIIGAIAFWLLVGSKTPWLLKVITIILFCTFTVGFYQSLSTFLGWSASGSLVPEIIQIHSVIIKEPNRQLNNKGRIYLLLDAVINKLDNKALNMLQIHGETKHQPRLFSVPYSRKLHEDLEKSVIPRTKQGQIVTGRLKKEGPGKQQQQQQAGGAKGTDSSKGDKGGSESQTQDLRFYNLKPGEITKK